MPSAFRLSHSCWLAGDASWRPCFAVDHVEVESSKDLGLLQDVIEALYVAPSTAYKASDFVQDTAASGYTATA